jgi:hypothetical protein
MGTTVTVHLSIRRQKDHPKMIISWLLRTNPIRWLVLFHNLSYLLLRGRKDGKSKSFTTTDEGFLEKLRRLRPLFRNRMDSVLYIREEGNKKRKKKSSSFFSHLGAVRDESIMHGFE